MIHKYRGKGGCLPRSANSVAKPESSSFEGGETAWKAGTLPTELLPLELAYREILNQSERENNFFDTHLKMGFASLRNSQD